MRRFLVLAFVALLPVASASSAHAESERSFVGLWEGVDPVDGGDSLRSITCFKDRSCKLAATDSVITLCGGGPAFVGATGALEGDELVFPDAVLTCPDGREVDLLISSNAIRATGHSWRPPWSAAGPRCRTSSSTRSAGRSGDLEQRPIARPPPDWDVICKERREEAIQAPLLDRHGRFGALAMTTGGSALRLHALGSESSGGNSDGRRLPKARRDRLGLDLLDNLPHHRPRRPPAATVDHGAHRVFRAGEYRLDRAVEPIAHPPRKMETAGLIDRPAAVPHALHASRDPHPNCSCLAHAASIASSLPDHVHIVQAESRWEAGNAPTASLRQDRDLSWMR
jgi:hypothetical protein